MKKVLGLGMAGIGAVALGMVIREVGVRKEKEMLNKSVEQSSKDMM